MSSPGATNTDPPIVWRLHKVNGRSIPAPDQGEHVSTLVIASRADLLAVIYPFAQTQRMIYERAYVHKGFADFILPTGAAALYFHLVEHLGEPRYRAR